MPSTTHEARVLAGAIAMMVLTSPRLAGLSVLALPLIVMPLVVYGRRVRRLSRDAQDTLANSAAFAQERLQAIATVQANVQEEAARRVFPPEIEFRAAGDRVGVGSGRVPGGGAEVVAVTFTPGLQEVEIASGDNRGRTVRQLNVVQSVRTLGEWNGRSALYTLPAARGPGQAVAVLVQARGDRRILNAAVLAPR